MPLTLSASRPPPRVRMRAQRLIAALAITLIGALPLARAQTAPSPEAAIAAASVGWMCTGMACRKIPHSPEVVDPTRLYCDRCQLLGLVDLAYGIEIADRVEGDPDWMGWDNYHVEIVAAAPVSRTQMNQVLLRRALERCFSLDTVFITKAVPGYALVVAPGGIKFQPVKEPPPFRIVDGIEDLTTLPQLATTLSQYYYDGKLFGVTRPIRDATGLSGYYNIPFPASPEFGENLLAVIGRLGLQVKPEQGVETKLKILHIDHLRTSCVIGPEAAHPEDR